MGYAFSSSWDAANDSTLFKLLLSYGITGVRDMGGSLEILNAFKKEIKANPQSGPEIFGAGPIIDGNPPVHADFSLPVDSSTNLVEKLDSLKKNGIDFFKVYSLLKERELKIIASYSSDHSIPFAGHLSGYIDPETSIKLGQKSVEHLNRLDDIWVHDKERLKVIATMMSDHHTWLCPTIITYYLKVHMVDSSAINNEFEKYVSPSLKEEWMAARKARIKRFSDTAQLIKQEALFKQQTDLVAYLYGAQIKLLAGSDFAGMPYVYPGIGLHQELELMVTAGISVTDALRAATINPAIYLGIEKKNGSVSAGKYADLVLLKENPLENIKNTQTITTVFKRGQQVN